MPLALFATRLPEAKVSYIKFKAMHTGKQQQELMTEIIDFYQQHDPEFMALFEQFLQSAKDNLLKAKQEDCNV